MAEDYPQKYQEYITVVQERDFQATLRRKTMESKRMALLVRLFIVTISSMFCDPASMWEGERERGREGRRDRKR